MKCPIYDVKQTEEILEDVGSHIMDGAIYVTDAQRVEAVLVQHANLLEEHEYVVCLCKNFDAFLSKEYTREQIDEIAETSCLSEVKK